MFGRKKYKEDIIYLWEAKLKRYIPEAVIKGFGDIMIDDKQIGLNMNWREVECYDEYYEDRLIKYANDINAFYFIKKYRID